jgi:hypothetical protein
MLIDLARYYPNVQSFIAFNGTHCNMCKIPFDIINLGNQLKQVKCDKCTLRIKFYSDPYACSAIDILNYKDYSFYYQPITTIRAADHISIASLLKYTTWTPFKIGTSFLSISEVDELITQGEAVKLCVPPVITMSPNLNI